MKNPDSAQFMSPRIFISRHYVHTYGEKQCDAIINRQGLVSYTVPSHQKVLMDLVGPDVLRSGIQNQQQLVNITGTILVSGNGYYLNDNPSVEQMKALDKLIAAGLVKAQQIYVY